MTGAHDSLLATANFSFPLFKWELDCFAWGRITDLFIKESLTELDSEDLRNMMR